MPIWEIHRVTKSGKTVKTVLATGSTEKEAWRVFNHHETWRCYPESASFAAILKN
jgi:hypothetical protein